MSQPEDHFLWCMLAVSREYFPETGKAPQRSPSLKLNNLIKSLLDLFFDSSFFHRWRSIAWLILLIYRGKCRRNKWAGFQIWGILGSLSSAAMDFEQNLRLQARQWPPFKVLIPKPEVKLEKEVLIGSKLMLWFRMVWTGCINSWRQGCFFNAWNWLEKDGICPKHGW